MKRIKDVHDRLNRLTNERQGHIEADHPEMLGQIDRIESSLSAPDIIIRSRTYPQVELFHRYYKNTPVTEKYLCVIVKILGDDLFVITAYYTDTIKGGDVLWEKK